MTWYRFDARTHENLRAYKRYTEWCQQIGLPAADFETWARTTRTIVTVANDAGWESARRVDRVVRKLR